MCWSSQSPAQSPLGPVPTFTLPRLHLSLTVVETKSSLRIYQHVPMAQVTRSLRDTLPSLVNETEILIPMGLRLWWKDANCPKHGRKGWRQLKFLECVEGYVEGRKVKGNATEEDEPSSGRGGRQGASSKGNTQTLSPFLSDHLQIVRSPFTLSSPSLVPMGWGHSQC